MKEKIILLTLSLLTSLPTLFGCADRDIDTDKSIECSVLSSVNLNGISVYGDFGEVVFSPEEDPTPLAENELLLFVNGSLYPEGSSFTVDGDVYLSTDIISDLSKELLLGEDTSITCKSDYVTLSRDGDDGSASHVMLGYTTLGDSTLISISDVCDYFGCDYTENGDTYMLHCYPHIMLSKYPDGAIPKTSDEAVDNLKNALIQAYESTYGEFEELDAMPAEYSDEAYLRYCISSLKIKSENNRFYIIECVFDFYVDKYTDDIFKFYNGIDETFTYFDSEDKNALAFAG